MIGGEQGEAREPEPSRRLVAPVNAAGALEGALELHPRLCVRAARLQGVTEGVMNHGDHGVARALGDLAEDPAALLHGGRAQSGFDEHEHPLRAQLPAERIVQGEAEPLSAVVSLKDSLLVPRQLEQVADCIDGRVLWAGCTKLHPRLDRRLLTCLAESGCRTLEFGLETLLPDSQALIAKRRRSRA